MAEVISNPRRIAAFTGTRAEYGLLRRVLLGLAAQKDCELQLIVSGTHLSQVHGFTLNEIRQNGLEPAAYVDLELSDDTTPVAVCNAMGKAISGVGRVLAALQSDILLVLGDRYETFCAAAAAQPVQIPVAHIHGGETTEGAMDEAFRHSITKMSHLHFTSCETYRQRVIQLGETPEKVWNVGALGVENVLNLPLPDERAIRGHLNLSCSQPYFVCTFHPVTLGDVPAAVQCEILLDALDTFQDYAIVFTGANADTDGSVINHLLAERAAAQPERYRFFMSLGTQNYLAAVRYAACVLGNSSSGVVEVPSLGTPAVDIGDRQKGRIRADSVLHSEHTTQDIVRAIHQALSPDGRARAQSAQNPYQKEGTAEAIVTCLRKWPLQGILQKSFYNLPLVGV